MSTEQHASNPKTAFGDYIKMKREAAGLTQRDLAKMLKYSSAQFVSNWERGLALPPKEALTKIAKPLNLDRTKVANLYLGHTEFLVRRAFRLKR